MSTYIHKRHNVSVLLYHAVCPAKYRRAVIDEGVGAVLRDVCLEIAARFEITEIAARFEITEIAARFEITEIAARFEITEIAARCEITFIEIGTDRDHVHFLMQSVPMLSPTQIVRTVKSITAKEVFRRVPSVKAQLWGGAFWSSGFFINTVGRYGSEETIRQYVREQGREKEYTTLHSQQLDLF